LICRGLKERCHGQDKGAKVEPHDNNQYCDHHGAEASSHHTLLPVIDINSIVDAYKSVKSGHSINKRR